jgi:hypothetical protein
MRRMNVIMRNEDTTSDDEIQGSFPIVQPGISHKHECTHCRTEFPNKTTVDRHMLFCKTLADIRRTSSMTSSVITTANDDALLPTQREMFILIQELATKYNKVKDELDVMKQWAKMVGRRFGTSVNGTVSLLDGSNTSSTAGAGAGAGAGLDFTSVTRQKRQNMEIILNEEDAEHPDLAELRPGFTVWLSSDTGIVLSEADLNIVFHEDLVAGITCAILRILSKHTVESGKSHLIPFKLADIKQGAFYIYDTAFKVSTIASAEIAPDLPTNSVKKWRIMEPCEFQLMVRTFHKLLFKEFKKWQDRNWEAQQRMTSQRQMAASSFQQVMSSFQSSSLMIPCDGTLVGSESITNGYGCSGGEDEPVTPHVSSADPVLSEDFATLYNKYADKMMGGALSDETILSRVRVKLWKDMKVWRL